MIILVNAMLILYSSTGKCVLSELNAIKVITQIGYLTFTFLGLY